MDFTLSTPMTPTLKRKRLYYGPEDDLVLLREVAGHNPYEDGGRWDTIAMNVNKATGKAFRKRSLQDRVTNLTEKYQKKMEEDQFKSGIEETVTEIDDLLISIILLIKEYKIKTPKATPYQIGYERREAAANLASANRFEDYQENPNIIVVTDMDTIEDLQEQECDIQDNNKEQGHDLNNKNKEEEYEIINKNKEEIVIRGKGRGRGQGRGGLTGTASKPRCSLKYSSIKFLEKKNDRWYEVRKRELDLEEKRYLLEKADRENKMEIERKRIQMDERRLQSELGIFENQQKLMEIAFSVKNRNDYGQSSLSPF